jgi:hypothetical protein
MSLDVIPSGSAGSGAAGLVSMPRLLSAEPAAAWKPYCCAAAVPRYVAEIAAAHGGTAEAARAFPRGLRIRLSLPGYASPRRIRAAAAPSSTSA